MLWLGHYFEKDLRWRRFFGSLLQRPENNFINSSSKPEGSAAIKGKYPCEKRISNARLLEAGLSQGCIHGVCLWLSEPKRGFPGRGVMNVSWISNLGIRNVDVLIGDNLWGDLKARSYGGSVPELSHTTPEVSWISEMFNTLIGVTLRGI